MSDIRTAVPEHETPAGKCKYCGQPFPTTERLVLHKGVEHPQNLDTSEEEAFRRAYADEDDALGTLRLKALATLVPLYFGFILLYAIYA